MIADRFKQCTVITVAHRVNTIIDSDMILGLDNGRLRQGVWGWDTARGLRMGHNSVWWRVSWICSNILILYLHMTYKTSPVIYFILTFFIFRPCYGIRYSAEPNGNRGFTVQDLSSVKLLIIFEGFYWRHFEYLVDIFNVWFWSFTVLWCIFWLTQAWAILYLYQKMCWVVVTFKIFYRL